MGWQYDYSLNDSRGASSGTLVEDLMTFLRIAPEKSSPKRGRNVTVPFRHGEIGSARKWQPGFAIPTEGHLRYTNSLGVVTHFNGGPGHVYENFHLWSQLVLGGQTQLWLGRDDPHAGLVEIPVEVLIAPSTTSPRNRMFTQFQTRWPFWYEETPRLALSTSFTLGGTAPVADAILKVVGGTDVKITHDQSGDYFQIEGATPAGGILIDCGERKATNVTGGASAEWQVEKSVPHWMEFEPGSVTFTVAGGGTVTVDLYEQHR